MATDKIFEELKTADFGDSTRFKRIQTPDFILRAQARARKQAEALQALDADVLEIIINHAENSEDMKRVNSAIRALFA